MLLNYKKTWEIISNSNIEIINKNTLIKKLKENRPLIIKFGCDPTAADIHLGHTIILNKLAQLQQIGHIIIFIIGDFTAKIGDPSGRSKIRPQLTDQELKINISTYKEQIFKFLDPNKTIIKLNGEWFDSMSVKDMIRIMSKQTVAKILERDNFSKRYKKGEAIFLHEFLYPLIQAYDSIKIHADIEFGGNDQKFNLLMGRELQKQFNQSAQVIIIMPLLLGINGIKKMSKSANNYIGINESPKNIFGKIMSIPDTIMWHYFDLLSLKSELEMNILKKSIKTGKNIRDIKFLLAKEIVHQLYNESAAIKAYNNFINIFQKKTIPHDIHEITIYSKHNVIMLNDLLVNSKILSSKSEVRRMITQGAIKINGVKIHALTLKIDINTSNIYTIGKRHFYKIHVIKEL